MVRRNARTLHRSRRPATGRRFLVLGPLAAAALVLAACGGDDAAQSAVTTAPAVSPAPAAESPATGAPAAAGSAGAETEAGDERVASADSTAMMYQPVEYVYDGEPPALDGPATGWRWMPGRVPTSDEIAAVASAFGLQGEVIEQPADRGGGWVIGSDTSPSLWVSQDAQGTWSFSGDTRVLCMDDADVGVAADGAAPAEPLAAQSGIAVGDPGDATTATVVAEPAEPSVDPVPADGAGSPAVAPPETVPCVEPVGIPTAEEAEARASELLATLGLDPAAYELHADSQEWGAWVDARLIVDGLVSPVSTSIGFGAEGAITYASGQLFGPEQGDTYERIGTAAALAQLQQDQLSSYSPVVDPAAADAAPEPRPADVPTDAPDAPAVGAEPDAPVEPIVLTLNGVAEGWWMTWSADGTVELLPGYDFTIADDGGEISAPAVAQSELPPIDTGVAEPAVDPAVDPAPAG